MTQRNQPFCVYRVVKVTVNFFNNFISEQGNYVNQWEEKRGRDSTKDRD